MKLRQNLLTGMDHRKYLIGAMAFYLPKARREALFKLCKALIQMINTKIKQDKRVQRKIK